MRRLEGLPTELLLLPIIRQEEKIKKVMGLLAMLDSGLEVALPNVGGPVDHLRVRETGGFAKGLNLILIRKWMRLREDKWETGQGRAKKRLVVSLRRVFGE